MKTVFVVQDKDTKQLIGVFSTYKLAAEKVNEFEETRKFCRAILTSITIDQSLY